MFDLLDYRRRVSTLYAAVRQANNPQSAWVDFRQERDSLFASHPQSALDAAQKAVFTGLRYYDYDPVFRVIAQIDTNVNPDVLDVDLGDDGHFQYKRIGQVHFTLPTGSGTLTLFWIMGYGGGLFLPFGDTTNRHATYGAGRYLYDTIKGADLGTQDDRIVLDFNFAYNPSCSYNSRWVCPLALSENRLPFPIPAGEQLLDR
ncbi:MAG: DUF1684 domain-containing protein [Anaerolineae bacterium]|nr:DUF1684 domain-containing protein [Anaerolineae bacterium]